MKRIRQFCFPERNRIFLALTGLLLPMIFIMVKYSDAPLILPAKWFGFFLCDPGADKTLYNIAVSHVAAYIFYIIQVYIPTASKEKRAWLLIRKPLSHLIRELKELCYITEQMIDFGEEGTAEISGTSCYYQKEYLDRYPGPVDSRPNRRMREGKYVRRAPGSCKNADDLREKLTRLGKQAGSLMNMQVVPNLDRYTNELLIEMDAEKLCDGVASDIVAIQHQEILGQKLTEAQAAMDGRKIQSIVKNLAGYSAVSKGSSHTITGPDQQTVQIQSNSYEKLPLHTGLKASLGKLKADIARLERYHDLDGEISFEKMAEDKIKEYDESNQLLGQAARSAFRQ